MSYLKKTLPSLLVLFFLLIIPLLSVESACDPSAGKICPPVDQTNLNDFIKDLLEGALKLGMPLVALAIIYCGFLFVTAIGNPEKITKANDALLYTLIGAAVLLGSWAIATLISDTVLTL